MRTPVKQKLTVVTLLTNATTNEQNRTRTT